jgi:tetratricopeptide (TPR) repeat protein
LTAVVFSGNTLTIGENAFANCPNIASITIPEGIAVIVSDSGNPFSGSQKLNLAAQARLRNMRWLPKDRDEFVTRGNAYTNKGEYDRSIADFTKQLQITPNDGYAYNERGNAYYSKGEYAKARADFTKALQINPNYTAAKENLAELERKGY